MTATTSAALLPAGPVFSTEERLALTGFLAGYSGLTREAYALDLRQFAAWCQHRQLRLFGVRRADIEVFAQELETAGRARATVTHRLCTIAGLYRYAVEEELLDHSPAAHVRRPRMDYESHAAGLDRNEVGALLVAASLGSVAEHALICLLALNGLRVSEATGADIQALGTERGHRTLAITRKGGKRAVIPLAPRAARAIDLAVGERAEGPIFTGATGDRLDRRGAGRIVRRVARRAGLAKNIGPHVLRHASPPPSTPACRSATSRKPPPAPTPAPPSGTTGPGRRSTATRPTPSPPTSPGPPGSRPQFRLADRQAARRNPRGPSLGSRPLPDTLSGRRIPDPVPRGPASRLLRAELDDRRYVNGGQPLPARTGGGRRWYIDVL